MTALLRRIATADDVQTQRPVRPLAPGDVRLLDALRDLARRAQLSPPLLPEHVCSLKTPSSPQAYGLALMRNLNAMALRPLVFHPRGAVEASFDEAWLLRLLRCLQGGDPASARLLIGGRIGHYGRRTVGWLALGLAERLERLTLDEPSLERF